MIKIAVIDKNKCLFNDLEKYAYDLLYFPYTKNEHFKTVKQKLNSYIWNVVKDYIEFTEISFVDNDNELFLEQICNILTNKFDKPLNNFYYHTESSFSFPKKYVEIMHCEPLWNEYKALQSENINNIGCYFCFEQKIVENRFLAIAYKYNNNSVLLDNISEHDITSIIKRRHIFSAILIKNDDLVKYYYNNKNFLLNTIFDKNSKVIETKITVLNYNLKLYSVSDSLYINKIGTRIYGEKQLFGDVLVFHEFEENVPANLSINELKRLSLLSYGRMYDRKLKFDEINQDIDVSVDKNNEKKNSIKSRYTVVNNRIQCLKANNFKQIHKCINCNSDNAKLTCNKCFRIKYCSIKCFNEYASDHDDCVVNC